MRQESPSTEKRQCQAQCVFHEFRQPPDASLVGSRIPNSATRDDFQPESRPMEAGRMTRQKKVPCQATPIFAARAVPLHGYDEASFKS